MPMTRTLFSALLLMLPMSAIARPVGADEGTTEQTAANTNQTSALVIFLTRNEPMQAGHAMHFATHALMDGRGATIVLVGEAGRLALAGQATPQSGAGCGNLQQQLQGFIDAGGQVYITPFTLTSIEAAPGDLIANIGPPKDPDAVHALMFAPSTKLLVW